MSGAAAAPAQRQPGEKLCSRCKEFWPADEEFFYVDPRSRAGLQSWCRACTNEVRTAARARRRSEAGAAAPAAAGARHD